MKKLIPLLLIVLAGAVMSNEPGEALENLVDAFYEGDACGVEACLSSNSINMLNMMLVMVKMQPDQAAAEISAELEIALTGDELRNWTTTDFIYVLISAPGITDQLPERENIEVSSCDIQGDSSTVFLNISDYPEEIPIAMVLEGDDWKLGESFLQSEL
ncbi:MAG: hypothetical protein KAR44_08175 [Candidatus Aegiribacteria sp.]|nr:hypothetical protein [Candidatus Aegiribacteria sp.]